MLARISPVAFLNADSGAALADDQIHRAQLLAVAARDGEEISTQGRKFSMDLSRLS